MPYILNKTAELDIKNITRRQGMRQYAKARPQIREIIDEVIEMVQRKGIIHGWIAYDLFGVRKIDKYRINVKGIELYGRALSILSSADEIAVCVCTIGDEIERMVSNLFSNGEALRGLLLDGIGSAAVDSISQQACQVISQIADARGLRSSSPVSPGMTGFDIEEQEKLFKLIQAGEIGVRHLPSGIMYPQKSVTMVIGLGRDMLKLTPEEFCRGCSMNRTCTHRVY